LGTGGLRKKAEGRRQKWVEKLKGSKSKWRQCFLTFRLFDLLDLMRQKRSFFARTAKDEGEKHA
jgi:hypothetical protein